ncbi:MAG: LytTR family DNA-binding domain-containing protein [Parasphingopyxis sp.]
MNDGVGALRHPPICQRGRLIGERRDDRRAVRYSRRMVMRLLLLICAGLLVPTAIEAQGYALVAFDPVRVCPADGTGPPADFSAPACEVTDFSLVDPQQREIWVEARLTVDPSMLTGEEPLGLRLSAKASSIAYVNGRRVGANGRPGADAASEIPGRMDAVFYLPRDHLRAGENVVTLRMSSMNGYLRLSNPVHMMAVGPYGAPHQRMLLASWPALVTLGAFLLGALYFGIMAWRGEDKEGSAIVALASLFAGLQLISEALRGITAYAYPVHDLRLMAILFFAAAFGLTLFAYLLLRLIGGSRRRRMVAVAALAAMMALVVVVIPGFDGKTWFALLTAVAAGMLAVIHGWRVGSRGAVPVGLLLVGLAATMLLFRSAFLDLPIYFAAAALLGYLFYRQAMEIVTERRARREEERRADRLELALAQARNAREPAQLELVCGSRTEFVSADRVVRFEGAGDYVEGHFEDDRSELYSTSLAVLEEELPETFIRIHRSHIVNTAFVRALDRDPSGTGMLRLADGAEVPVSRRIMPSVRAALSSDR